MICSKCKTDNVTDANYCKNCGTEFSAHKQERLKRLERAETQLKEAQRLKKRTKLLGGWATAFGIIALIFAYLFYNSSDKQSSENPPLTDSIQPAKTPNGISTSTGANSAVTVSGNSITVNANNGNIDTTINGRRIIVNTGHNYEKQTQKQEQQVTPPNLAEQAKKKQAEEQARKEQTKQALEKANAAFQKGIKGDTGNKENFEEAYQLYLKYNKKEGYRKFKERADQFQREGLDHEYQYFMNYANRLK